MKIKIKISLVLLSCCLLSMVSWADKVQEGIELYKCGLTLPAKQVLLSELQKNGPEAAEICYYLGEIYSLIPRSDSALFYYRQGLAIDPAYLQNRVGEGKLMLVEEPYKAEEIFKEAVRYMTAPIPQPQFLTDVTAATILPHIFSVLHLTSAILKDIQS